MTVAFFRGFAVLLAYFVCAAGAVLLLRRHPRMKRELFRKMLHGVVLFSLPVFLYAFPLWWLSALAAVAFVALVYPALALSERKEGYAELLTQRKDGEIKRSLVLVFTMFATVIAVCWGLMDDRLLALACVYAWGFGDAAAALVGRRFGRKALRGRRIEGCKSVEGTLAMFAVSFVSVFAVMMIRGGLSTPRCAATALLTAIASALTELYTPGGMDTVTCPSAAMAVIVPLVLLWQGVPL